MGIFDDPINPHAVEMLRRSIAMLSTGQAATMDRERALSLLGELQRLQHQQRTLETELEAMLDRLIA